MRRALAFSCMVAALTASAAVVDDFSSRTWKAEIAKGYVPYLKLRYEDYPLSDGVPVAHDVYTQGFVHFDYGYRYEERDNAFVATVTTLDVRSGFDLNKSWRRSTLSETRALIEHEQGHLDINELHACDFRKAKLPEGRGKTPKDAVADLAKKLDDLADQYGKEAQREQDDYDRSTNHGRNLDAQSTWTMTLQNRLTQNQIKYWDRVGWSNARSEASIGGQQFTSSQK